MGARLLEPQIAHKCLEQIKSGRKELSVLEEALTDWLKKGEKSAKNIIDLPISKDQGRFALKQKNILSSGTDTARMGDVNGINGFSIEKPIVPQAKITGTE